MPNTKSPFATKLLEHATQLLNHVENSTEAMNALAHHGYTAHKFSEGRQLLGALQIAMNGCAEQKLRQKAATVRFHAEWKELSELHQIHLSAARHCLPKELEPLLLARTQGYLGWVAQVDRFYSLLLGSPSCQAELSAMSITVESLFRAQQGLAMLISCKDQQQQSQHNLRVLQRQKDNRLREFKAWFGLFIATARITLHDQPAMLQLLRMTPTPTRAATNTAQPSAANVTQTPLPQP